MKGLRPSLIVLAVCATLLAAVYAVLLHPRRTELLALQRELVALHALTADAPVLERQLQSARTELRGARHAAQALRERFLAESDTELFVAEVLRCAHEAGLAIQQVRPGAIRIGNASNEFPLELEVEGSFPQLMELLVKLAALGRPCALDRISIQGEPMNGGNRASVRISLSLLKQNVAI